MTRKVSRRKVVGLKGAVDVHEHSTYANIKRDPPLGPMTVPQLGRYIEKTVAFFKDAMDHMKNNAVARYTGPDVDDVTIVYGNGGSGNRLQLTMDNGWLIIRGLDGPITIRPVTHNQVVVRALGYVGGGLFSDSK